MNEEGFHVTLHGQTIKARRPEPITAEIEVMPYHRGINPKQAVEALEGGLFVLIEDVYSSGLEVLKALKNHLRHRYTEDSFQDQRKFRAAFRELSHKILVEIGDGRPMVRKAPDIGWLKILYPDVVDFLLPFPQLQGLNSSWQWYSKGVAIPGLQPSIHPFYDTYFPTRFEHLELFDRWLKAYAGAKHSALDVGVGAGVLTFFLLKHGFQHVFCTDSNPNALIGMQQSLTKRQLTTRVELGYGDLFAHFDQKVELIVFNPPWIPANSSLEGLDQAIYYDDQLFPRFFEQASTRLTASGSLVLLFSNLADQTHTDFSHPIQHEIEQHSRFRLESVKRQQVGRASSKTKRNQFWRSSEEVELWVLRPNTP